MLAVACPSRIVNLARGFRGALLSRCRENVQFARSIEAFDKLTEFHAVLRTQVTRFSTNTSEQAQRNLSMHEDLAAQTVGVT